MQIKLSLVLVSIFISNLYAYTNYYDIQEKKQELFISDMLNFQNNYSNIYETFVNIHNDLYENYHHNNSTNLFLFHRHLIDKFVMKIKFHINSEFELFYWDISEELFNEKIILDFGGYGIFCYDIPYICFQRISFKQKKHFLYPQYIIEDYLQNIDHLNDFSHLIEYGIHDHFHVFMGGTFDSYKSPRDLLFWPFHKYIDYLFERWASLHGYKINELTFDSDFFV